MSDVTQRAHIDESAVGAHEGSVHRSLQARHLVMIALGGVIGSGLFISSGYTIHQAGPLGAVLAYLVGALVAWLVVACLGELAVQYPVSGGFQVYAHKAIGPAAGFITAWLYWLCWVAALGSEFTASGLLMQRWFPSVPVWVWCAVFAIGLFLLNAISVRGFGEAEFWLSGIKVAAIVIVIVTGFAVILGFHASDGHAPLLSNFHTSQGYFPNGISGVLSAILAVIYAFSGTELIAIAAGETKDPHTVIPKALRVTLIRLVLFFVGAIFVIAALVPWNSTWGDDDSVEASPFVSVFHLVGIPYAADIIAVVVVVALLSAGNSGLYACSRLLFSLAQAGQVHPVLGRVTRRGVPLVALAVSLAAGLVSLISSVASPDAVYLALVSVAGFAVVAVWAVIAYAQILNRRQIVQAGVDLNSLHYRTPGHPWVPAIAIVVLAISLIAVAFDSNQVSALIFGVPFVLLCYGYYYMFLRTRSDPFASVVDEAVKTEDRN
ncbi:amino acid permease [Mycolicibacterium sp. Y3]